MHPGSKNSIFLSTKIWFGKYKEKDKSIYQIIVEDLDYADWLLSKALEDRYIDPRVWKMFKEKWEQQNMKKYGFRNDNLNK